MTTTLRQPDAQRTQRLSRRSIVLGREPNCDLTIHSRHVSRRHAEIYLVGDLWWVRDLGSQAGTFLDGDPIDAAPLSGRAVIRLGEEGPAIVLEPAKSTPSGPSWSQRKETR